MSMLISYIAYEINTIMSSCVKFQRHVYITILR